MKRCLCLLLLLSLLLSGCGQERFFVKPFSYANHYEEYRGHAPGVRHDGFQNTKNVSVQNAKTAVELAKNECGIDYGEIDVYYDPIMGIYMVMFSPSSQIVDGHTVYAVGGCLSVYLNSNGQTLLVVAEE